MSWGISHVANIVCSWKRMNQPLAYDRSNCRCSMPSRSCPTLATQLTKSVCDPKFELLFQVKLTAIPSFGVRNATTLRAINPHGTSVCRASFPPWLIANPSILFDLPAMQSKGNAPRDVNEAQFAELLDKFRIHLTIYSDGSKIGASARRRR